MKKVYSLILFSFLFAFASAQYCTTGSVKDNKHLSLPKVTLSNFSHTFTYDSLSYYDFTGLDTINLGTNITHTLNIDWQTKQGGLIRIAAYLDFNTDSIFSTTTEKIMDKVIGYSQVVPNSGRIISSFNLPPIIQDGKLTRLRIRFSDSYSSAPCDSNSYYLASRDYLVRFNNCSTFSSFLPPNDTTLAILL